MENKASIAKRIHKIPTTGHYDIDGLLINSKSFNQLFVMRRNSNVLKATVSSIINSEKHLKSFLSILTAFITAGKHPQFANIALQWFQELLAQCPNLMRASYASPYCRKICAHFQNIKLSSKGIKYLHQKCISVREEKTPTSKNDSIPFTGYVFVDDSDCEYGDVKLIAAKERDSKRARLKAFKSLLPSSTQLNEDDDMSSDDSQDYLNDIDLALNREEQSEPSNSVDDGIFDVDSVIDVDDNCKEDNESADDDDSEMEDANLDQLMWGTGDADEDNAYDSESE